MIEKILTVKSSEYDSAADDLAYWLSRPPDERLAAVELLRHRVFELPSPIEPIVEVHNLDDRIDKQ
jgi:hypothetical protein